MPFSTLPMIEKTVHIDASTRMSTRVEWAFVTVGGRHSWFCQLNEVPAKFFHFSSILARASAFVAIFVVTLKRIGLSF